MGDSGQKIEPGSRQDNKTAADSEREAKMIIGVSIEPGNKRGEDLKREDKGDSTREQNFTSCSFLLVARLFFFFTTFSLESVTT